MITNEKAFILGIRDFETGKTTEHEYKGEDLKCYEAGWTHGLRRQQLKAKTFRKDGYRQNPLFWGVHA